MIITKAYMLIHQRQNCGCAATKERKRPSCTLKNRMNNSQGIDAYAPIDNKETDARNTWFGSKERSLSMTVLRCTCLQAKHPARIKKTACMCRCVYKYNMMDQPTLANYYLNCQAVVSIQISSLHICPKPYKDVNRALQFRLVFH
jgi:hypothetical protein